MKNKITRKALLLSTLSLLLCFAMLLGTTFAWFTDSVTSTNNIIKAGTLDVELYYMNDETTNWTKVEANTNIFKEDTLWEPGHTEVVQFRVVNEGSLALNYQLGVNVVSEIGSTNVSDETFLLSNYIKYGVVDGAENYSRETAVSAVAATATPLSQALTSATTELLVGAEKTVTMVVYMPEAVGNEVNHKSNVEAPSINLGINLVATQQTYESDSFGTDYDTDSQYPVVSTVNVAENTLVPTEVKAGEVSIYIPARANSGEYKLEVSNKAVTTGATGTKVTYDIGLYKDGVEVEGVSYPVKIEIGKYLNVQKLEHNGEEINAYEYNPATGILSFETTSFSPFAVTYTSALGDDAKVEDGKIVAGTFDTNPVAMDPSLGEADSEYIAVNYTKNGKTMYVVSKRATTIVLKPSDTDYASVNGNYTVDNVDSNGLYSKISALQNNDFSTVYLLPGTYNVATVVYVYSSMDIIGLGDKDAVKIIKKPSSKSNRHIFNCNGTKAEYINVTIRNLYLDASAKNDLSSFSDKDNAAVQSIRKSKVKCYDLTVIKGTGFGYAFYVNANNAVDGVTYPAYMYVENCTVDVTNSAYIRTTNGTNSYFYYNNLTYNNGSGTYSTNSGKTKNQAMTYENWNW